MNVIVRTSVPVLLALMLVGCVTPINWQARVGVYTYEQAVMDYGPPDKSARLNDRTLVTEWMTERGAVIVTPGPYWYGPGYVVPMGTAYSTSYFPGRFLRLSFSADGKLKAWKEFSK